MGGGELNGVVGYEVNTTDNHISRVISVLNESQLFSVKLKGTPFIVSTLDVERRETRRWDM